MKAGRLVRADASHAVGPTHKTPAGVIKILDRVSNHAVTGGQGPDIAYHAVIMPMKIGRRRTPRMDERSREANC